MNLTTRTRLKTWMSYPDAKDTDDSVLDMLIASVSAEIERFIRRPTKLESRTEYLDVEYDGQKIFSLTVYPVSSITSVNYDPGRDFVAATDLDSDDYNLLHGGEAGMLHLEIETKQGPNQIKVVYTAGFAADTATLYANYPDIEQAALMQADFMFRQRRNLGAVSTGGNAGNVSFNDTFGLIEPVRNLLKRFVRL